MRKLLFIVLLFTATASNAQIPGVYLNIANSNGSMITGSSQLKGYEKWIQSLTFATGGTNNSTVDFTMSISGASAEFMAAMNRVYFLPKGTISSLDYGGGGSVMPLYTITMENIQVITCRDVMGCNSALVTSVQLRATRIGWTYYEMGADGRIRITRKYGYDTETGKEWDKF
jgi:type VI protein secretion system component Hcp